ncbi:hypothetical protein K432DRAFT_42784 [Lepidopterella palustris CBS 459.81]|uniref:Uncharacterized protein n=1 Tax=Lepidopterella palustris CBS 459.81 TaxID=1314670 RepID=A0A8E2EAY4_9PEZI|nr:hypothetical protein K432DRAFT_42784 [Lepidopterella palustris CBS 459.81]
MASCSHFLAKCCISIGLHWRSTALARTNAILPRPLQGRFQLSSSLPCPKPGQWINSSNLSSLVSHYARSKNANMRICTICRAPRSPHLLPTGTLNILASRRSDRVWSLCTHNFFHLCALISHLRITRSTSGASRSRLACASSFSAANQAATALPFESLRRNPIIELDQAIHH